MTSREAFGEKGSEIDDLRAECDDWAKCFDMYNAAMCRARAAFKANHPEWPDNCDPDTANAIEDILEQLHVAKAQRDEAVQLLRDTREALEDWGAYVNDYFKEKHRFSDDLARIGDFLARIDKENGDAKEST